MPWILVKKEGHIVISEINMKVLYFESDNWSVLPRASVALSDWYCLAMSSGQKGFS